MSKIKQTLYLLLQGIIMEHKNFFVYCEVIVKISNFFIV